MGREVLRLTKGLLAVKYRPDGHGLLFRLSNGEEVEVLGTSVIPACVEVVCKGECFHVFDVDLRCHSSSKAELALVARRQWKGARSLQAV